MTKQTNRQTDRLIPVAFLVHVKLGHEDLFEEGFVQKFRFPSFSLLLHVEDDVTSGYPPLVLPGHSLERKENKM